MERQVDERSALLFLIAVILVWGCLFPQAIGLTHPGDPTKDGPLANQYNAAFNRLSVGSVTTPMDLENWLEPIRQIEPLNSNSALAEPCTTVALSQVSAVWIGGTGNWNVPTNWSGGVVPNNGTRAGTTYAVFIDNGSGGASSNVTLNIAATVDSLTIDSGDTLVINDAMSLTIVNSGPGSGTIINDGVLALNATINSPTWSLMAM